MKLFWMITIGLLLILLGGWFFFSLMLGSIYNMAEKAEKKVALMDDYELLSQPANIEEVANSLGVLPADFRPEVTTQQLGKTSINQAQYAQDPLSQQETITLENHQLDYHFILKDSVIYQINQKTIGQLVYQFKQPAFTFLNYAVIVNEDYFLVAADFKTGEQTNCALWQVNKSTFELTNIDELHYSYQRKPLVFSFENLNDVLLVYYTGNIAFSTGGGDNARPEYSVVRVYNRDNPQGKDIIRMSFAAGVIVNLEAKENGWLITTDPSLPRTIDRLGVQPRTWLLTFN